MWGKTLVVFKTLKVTPVCRVSQISWNLVYHSSLLFVGLFFLIDISVSCCGGTKKLETMLAAKVGVVSWDCGQLRPDVLNSLLQVLILYKALEGSFPQHLEAISGTVLRRLMYFGICNLEYAWIIFSAFSSNVLFCMCSLLNWFLIAEWDLWIFFESLISVIMELEILNSTWVLWYVAKKEYIGKTFFMPLKSKFLSEKYARSTWSFLVPRMKWILLEKAVFMKSLCKRGGARNS